MTAKVHDLELSGLVFPPGNQALTRQELGNADERADDYAPRFDFHTFFYDCFFDPVANEVVLLCPPLLNFRKLLGETRFQIDGTDAEPVSIDDISRCTVVTFRVGKNSASVLAVSHALFGGNICVGRSFLDDFRGTNALFAISKNNELEWISDWLTYYTRRHGADAVVFSDNLSTNYSMAELRETIAKVPGIKVAAIIRARYPFGPSAETKVGYKSLFLQRSLAELCRRRFLGHARAVLNVDIDELIHSKSGASVFDATVAASQGYLRANAEWVYAKSTGPNGYARHSDHAHISQTGKPKANRKWCVVPDGPQQGRQWLTHFLGSRKDPVDPDFTLWHFRQVSTSWKVDRSGADQPPLVESPSLKAAMQETFLHKSQNET